jgi:GNAT superfamily N-acetyltransferase
MISIREISADKITNIKQINRAEHIFGYYQVRNGRLILIKNEEKVQAFDPAELEQIIRRQIKLIKEGGKVIGAFDQQTLVGVASVERKLRGIYQDCCKMDILYVSEQCRGIGVGRQLTEEIKKIARQFGAKKLYISATPTKNTVDFYLSLGATLTSFIDTELFQLEPDDIHLELSLELK